jgi:hypothetical protein
LAPPDPQDNAMTRLHIAQLNIGRMRTPLEHPAMAGFVARLDEINALADASPGFVWRLKADGGNATYLRPYDDDRILFNMSVWDSVEHLRRFVYGTMHVEVMRQRDAWFDKFAGAFMALWWVPAGHVPSVDEGKQRLAHLDAHGPTQFAFTFRSVVQPDDDYQRAIDWSSFKPCPAA